MSTIGQLATKSAVAYPQKIAVKYKDTEMTYSQLLERAHALTAYFHAIGYVKVIVLVLLCQTV